jgi:hypothetical protein
MNQISHLKENKLAAKLAEEELRTSQDILSKN